MQHWSNKRLLSFYIHLAFVTVPFLASALSSAILWHDLFDSWWYAVPMVLTVDILTLTGLILYIARVPSPFVPLRHFLPVVSVVPLARELYSLLERNGWIVAGIVTAIVIALFTWIAWQCWRTIEQLFVSPVEAASEQARERLSEIETALAQLTVTRETAERFAAGWTVTKPPRLTVAAARIDSEPTVTVTAPVLASDSGKSAKVRALAVLHNVSEATAWRKVRKGEWRVEE